MSQIIIDAIAIVISLAALFFAIQSDKKSKISIVKEFFEQGDSVEHKQFRKEVYDLYNRGMDDNAVLEELIKISSSVAHIVSFYDFWALMVKKSYLLPWVFEGMPGKTAINIFEKIRPYIRFRREKEPEYAVRFEQLINRIMKLKFSK